jgi:ATP-dependent DNA ligase
MTTTRTIVPAQPEFEVIMAPSLVPSGSLWLHEIKHDGYRPMVGRDGARVRCFTRNGMTGPTAFPPSWTTWYRGRRRVGASPEGQAAFEKLYRR